MKGKTSGYIVLLLFFCFIASHVHGLRDPAIEKNILSIKKSLQYLEQKNIPHTELRKKLGKYLIAYAAVKKSSRRFTSGNRELISLKISILKQDLKTRVDQVKRLDFLYVIMLGFCIITTMGFLLYGLKKFIKSNKIEDV